jgi:hypothetical protein
MLRARSEHGSSSQQLRERIQERGDGVDLRPLGDERERGRVDPARPAGTPGVDRRPNDRAFRDQGQQRRPGWQVQRGEDVEGIARLPRRAGAPAPGQLHTQGIEPRLRLGVVLGKTGQHADQPGDGGHADVVVEHRPPDLEDRDEVVLGQHVVGQQPAVAPARRPALEAQTAGGEHGVGRLLRRQGTRVDGAPGDEEVGERRQLFVARRGQRPSR